MSRIDMSKPGAHKVTSSVEPVLRDDRTESYIQYLDACGQLLTKYKSDIEFIEEMQAKLRKEKMHFFENDLPRVRNSLKNEGIPEEQINEWIKEVKDNYDNSFMASEKILNDFSMASIYEMKYKIEEILNG